jgi:hypothetical protein
MREDVKLVSFGSKVVIGEVYDWYFFLVEIFYLENLLQYKIQELISL